MLAPTGTISFLMDCDTTGIEPDIALVKYKLLAGGGMLKIVNQTVKPALEKLGYNSEEIERIIAHIDAFDTIEDVTDTRRLDDFIRLEAGASADLRLRIQAVQRRALVRLHGAPANDGGGAAVPQRRDFQDRQHAGNGHVDEIMNTYIEGWRLGLKGDRDLPRRLEALRAVEHAQDEGHGRLRSGDVAGMMPRAAGRAHSRTGRRTRDVARPDRSTGAASHARHAHVA